MPDPNHPILDVKAKEVAKTARAPQIRPLLQQAIRSIVTEGLSVPDAAKRAGMAVHSLQVALRKPHVRAFMTHVKDAWMDSRTSKAWLNIADLADGACSEDVRLKANRTFLEAAGELGFKGKDAESAARTLVQIVVNSTPQQQQPTVDRLPGVIEAQPFQVITHQPSDSQPVRRAVIEADDAD